jgi:hypothetical protein
MYITMYIPTSYQSKISHWTPIIPGLGWNESFKKILIPVPCLCEILSRIQYKQAAGWYGISFEASNISIS